MAPNPKMVKVKTFKPIGLPRDLIFGQGSPSLEPMQANFYFRRIKKS